MFLSFSSVARVCCLCFVYLSQLTTAALNERKADIRLQFHDVPGQLFEETPRNELVIRIQPQECTYLKVQVKTPGLEVGTQTSELDLTYASRYEGKKVTLRCQMTIYLTSCRHPNA